MRSSVKMTKEEYDAYCEKHHGSRHVVFYKDDMGRKRVVFDFDAKDIEDASAKFGEFVASKAGDGVEYMFTRSHDCFVRNEDGTVTMIAADFVDDCRADSINDGDDDNCNDERPSYADIRKEESKTLEDIRDFIKNYDPRHGNLDKPSDNEYDKYSSSESLHRQLVDFFDNFDLESRSSHMESEMWSLDAHVIEDIKYNVRKLMTMKHGVPNRYVCADIDKLSKEDQRKETAAAVERFNAKLTHLLETIAEYEFYIEGYCDEEKNDMSELERRVYAKLQDNFPYIKNTDKTMVDYDVLSDLIDKAWHKIWKEWDEIGRECWD